MLNAAYPPQANNRTEKAAKTDSISTMLSDKTQQVPKCSHGQKMAPPPPPPDGREWRKDRYVDIGGGLANYLVCITRVKLDRKQSLLWRTGTCRFHTESYSDHEQVSSY